MDEHMELLVELMRKTIEQKDEQIQKLNETIEELRVTYNVPYRVDKFKSSFPEIRQVKVPIPSEMDR